MADKIFYLRNQCGILTFDFKNLSWLSWVMWINRFKNDFLFFPRIGMSKESIVQYPESQVSNPSGRMLEWIQAWLTWRQKSMLYDRRSSRKFPIADKCLKVSSV